MGPIRWNHKIAEECLKLLRKASKFCVFFSLQSGMLTTSNTHFHFHHVSKSYQQEFGCANDEMNATNVKTEMFPDECALIAVPTLP